MPNNIEDLIKRGSTTAKAGFSNETDVVNKFNAWKKDLDAQQWLQIMNHRLDEIESVEAKKVKGSHKTDVQVRIVFLKGVIAVENISVKLVSNPQGFNQIDKRWVYKFEELWLIPKNIASSLKHFTGEVKPVVASTRDPRRVFLDEIEVYQQRELVEYFENNKNMIIVDIMKGRDEFAAEWMLIYQKNVNKWSFLPISLVMNFYGSGKVTITKQGSLKIGEVTMQRKGGDNGRKTAQMLQFKFNPCKIVNDR